MNDNPFAIKDKLIFVRYRPNYNVRFRGKNFDVVGMYGNSELIMTSQAMYEVQRDWLVKRPILSLAIEIQLINPVTGCPGHEK